MKHEPVKNHAERKRIFTLIERCEKEQTMSGLNLKAVEQAVADGRLEAWVNSNGEICFYNHRSKRIYIVDCTQNMDYDPSSAKTKGTDNGKHDI